MKICNVVTSSSLCLFFVIFVCSTSKANRNNRPNRGRRQHNGGSQQQLARNDQYSYVCPTVLCQALPENCQTIEFFVMEIQHTAPNGQRAVINCESCEYCLDVPTNRRLRRSAPLRRHHDCSSFSCPDVPSDCADERMTDVLVGNTKCRQCPACYDNTVFNRT